MLVDNENIYAKLPQIESNRLVVKILQPGSANLVLDYLIRNKDHVQSWIPTRSKDYYTLQFQEKKLDKLLELYNSGKEFRFYIFHKNDRTKIIGDLSFFKFVKGAFWSCFVSYALDYNCLKQGIMTEAVQAGVKYMFDVQNAHRVSASVMPENKKSINVLERSGFQFEGLCKNYLRINSSWKDHKMYAITNDNWNIQM